MLAAVAAARSRRHHHRLTAAGEIFVGLGMTSTMTMSTAAALLPASSTQAHDLRSRRHHHRLTVAGDIFVGLGMTSTMTMSTAAALLPASSPQAHDLRPVPSAACCWLMPVHCPLSLLPANRQDRIGGMAQLIVCRRNQIAVPGRSPLYRWR